MARGLRQYLCVLPGGFAAGLREWAWVQCQLGVLNFPFDFPNTRAHVHSQEEINANEVAGSRGLKSKPVMHTSCSIPWFEILEQANETKELCISSANQISERDTSNIEENPSTRISFCISYSAPYSKAIPEVNFAVYLVKIDGKGTCKVGTAVCERRGQGALEEKRIIGFVTSSYPRGSKGFPGGLSVCRTPTGPSNSGDSAGRLVEVKGKGSSVWRAAHIIPIVYADWCKMTM